MFIRHERRTSQKRMTLQLMNTEKIKADLGQWHDTNGVCIQFQHVHFHYGELFRVPDTYICNLIASIKSQNIVCNNIVCSPKKLCLPYGNVIQWLPSVLCCRVSSDATNHSCIIVNTRFCSSRVPTIHGNNNRTISGARTPYCGTHKNTAHYNRQLEISPLRRLCIRCISVRSIFNRLQF